MHYLYLTAPGMPAQKFLLDRPVTTIGRSSMNDLPVSDKMLSRQHARIVREGGGGLTVEDLGSRNGTFLNGERLVSVQPLKSGDRITSITWKVDVQPTKYLALPFTAKNPEGARDLHWTAHEHLADGSVVDWSDKPGSKEKGSVTKLTAGIQ